jgi:acyl-CoA reductase-like NAD-dependent aldehyde dehydrogenase
MPTAVLPDALSDRLQRTPILLLIDGKRVPAQSGKTFEVLNPATEQVIATVAEAGAADIDLAVAAARRAFDAGVWRDLPGAERGRILLRFADLVEQNAEEIALTETMNNGMPKAFARGSVASGVRMLRWFAGATTRIGGQALGRSLSQPGEFLAYTRKEPIGVVGLITPWNGPIGTFMLKVSPALAAGCSCVHKPSEITPLTALRLGELALEAGLPAGVLNIVPGFGADAGAAMANHPGINKISFTGSTAVGKELVRLSAGNLKRVTLELGGKSPCVVFDDADMDLAIPGAAMAIAMNSGQVCFAGSRLFVQRKSYDRVIEGIGQFLGTLKVGNGMEDGIQLGPLVSARQRDRVQEYIRIGEEEGAERISGGQVIDGPGFFVSPTVFAGVDPSMRIVREEIFGPVLVATPFDEPEEIPALANATNYGLGAGIFTTNINTAHKLAARIEAGNVWVNCYSMLDAAMPFGGFKESGWGREASEEGLGAFLETKSVWVKLH